MAFAVVPRAIDDPDAQLLIAAIQDYYLEIYGDDRFGVYEAVDGAFFFAKRL